MHFTVYCEECHFQDSAEEKIKVEVKKKEHVEETKHTQVFVVIRPWMVPPGTA